MSYYDNEGNGGFGFNGGRYDDSAAGPNPNEFQNNAQEPPIKPVKPKKERKVLKFLTKTICAGLIFGLVTGGVFYGFNRALGVDPASALGTMALGVDNWTIEGTGVSTAVAINDVSDIAKNTLPSIVQVTNVSVVEYRGFFGFMFEKEVPAAGSGFVVSRDKDNLYIATNHHVVENSKEITVTFSDDTAVQGEVRGSYQKEDVAVISVKIADIPKDTLDVIKVAVLGDSDELLVGQSVVVIGNALGYGTSVTTGVVSALNREITAQSSSTGENYTGSLIQTDATVNGGNSGGALLDMKGEVIGIVNSKIAGTGVEGMGYAIPITAVKEILSQIITTGEYAPESDPNYASEDNGAYLGIYGGMDIDEATAKQYDLPIGVYVSEVIDDSPAETAGIKKGDIITAFNGVHIASMAELKSEIGKCVPGDEAKVTFAIASNNYMEKTSNITLMSRPED